MADKPLTTIPEKERWWAALSYVFSPFLPAALIFILDLDEYRFLRQHVYQAIVLGILFLLVMPLILATTLGLGGLFWLVLPYYAMLAFNGQNISIPWVSDWVKSHGWN